MSSTSSSSNPIESPVRPLSEPDHWSAPGLAEIAATADAAAAARDARVAAGISAVARIAAVLARKLLVEPVQHWVERERVLRELSMLNERELADLGITPGQIYYVASGHFDPDSAHATPPRAVNENRPLNRVA